MSYDAALLDDLRRQVKVGPRRPIGTFDKPNLRQPAKPEDIVAAEKDLDLCLPPLLRQLYTEVADGGFGPGYGLLPINREEDGLVAVRRTLAADGRWPPLLLPLCDWGCAIWSCLDCRSDDGCIVTASGLEPFKNTGHDLRSWLRAWLAGKDLFEEMFEAGQTIEIVNTFTKQPVKTQSPGKPRGSPWP